VPGMPGIGLQDLASALASSRLIAVLLPLSPQKAKRNWFRLPENHPMARQDESQPSSDLSAYSMQGGMFWQISLNISALNLDKHRQVGTIIRNPVGN